VSHHLPLGVTGAFPGTRPRRNRQTAWSRNLVAETTLTVNDLIWPVFVIEGTNQTENVASMPGVTRYSIDLLVKQAKAAADLGIPAIALFPKVDSALKTEKCEEAINPDNLICRAVKAIKDAVPQLGIICDVALDPYSSHGHDGLVVGNEIVNDPTVEMLVQQSLVQAEAGCDIIAPSDMMDGRIAAIRAALDEKSLERVQLLSYAAKYASAYYGPFRDAIGSGGALKGDKKTYQMDPANSNEALKEVALDIQEGADMLMIKPGMPYLDIIYKTKQAFALPTFAYQVSGEYAMIKAAANNGWLDYEKTIIETLTCFKRAGADGVLTYTAIDAAKILNDA
jgi:porphobilinogen synthase